MERHNDRARGARPGTVNPLAGLWVNAPAWDDAICLTMPEKGDLWFSDKLADRIEAADGCEICPHRDRCLADALDRGEQYGIWGGVDLNRKHRKKRYKGAA